MAETTTEFDDATIQALKKIGRGSASLEQIESKLSSKFVASDTIKAMDIIRKEKLAMQGQPAPVQGQPAPVQGQPAPVQGQPAPVQGQPAPVQEQPAPAPVQPAPMQEQPAPMQEQPAPMQEQPAPMQDFSGVNEGRSPLSQEDKNERFISIAALDKDKSLADYSQDLFDRKVPRIKANKIISKIRNERIRLDDDSDEPNYLTGTFKKANFVDVEPVQLGDWQVKLLGKYGLEAYDDRGLDELLSSGKISYTDYRDMYGIAVAYDKQDEINVQDELDVGYKVAQISNIESRISDIVPAIATSLNIANYSNELAVKHKELNNLIVEVLRANGVDVAGVSKGGDTKSTIIVTKDGPAPYGAIVYRDKKGNKRIADSNFLQDLYASKNEAMAGAVAGAAVVMPYVAATGGVTWPIIALGALIGGVGAAIGSIIDKQTSAWDLKMKLDYNKVFQQAEDTMVFDTMFSFVGEGIGIGISRLSQNSIRHTIKNSSSIQARHAVRAIKDMTGKSEEDLVEMVVRYNEIKGTKLIEDSDKSIIQVAIETIPQVRSQVKEAIKRASKSGSPYFDRLANEIKDSFKLFKGGANTNLIDSMILQLDNSKKAASRLYGAVQKTGNDLIRIAENEGLPKLRWNFKDQIEELMFKMENKLKPNIHSDAAIKQFDELMQKLRRLGAYDTSDLAKSEKEYLAGLKTNSQQFLENKKILAKQKADKEKAWLLKQVEIKQKTEAKIDALVLERKELKEALKEDKGNSSKYTSRIKTLNKKIDEAKADLKYIAKEKELGSAITNMQKAKTASLDAIFTARYNEFTEAASKISKSNLDAAGENALEINSGYRDFDNLLEFRKLVGGLKRKTDDPTMIKYFDMLDEQLGKTIETYSKQYMGDQSEHWLKMYKGVRRDWAGIKDMETTTLMKELMKPEANYDVILKQTIADASTARRVLHQIGDRLMPNQRRNLEFAVFNKFYEEAIEASEKTGINWVQLHDNIKNVPVRSKEGKGFQNLTKAYAEIFGNRSDIGKALADPSATQTSRGISTTWLGRAKTMFINLNFRSIIGTLGLTTSMRQTALINTMAKVLDDPLDAKSVTSLLSKFSNIIDVEKNRTIIKELQEEVIKQGELKGYGITSKGYSVGVGKPPKYGKSYIIHPDKTKIKGNKKNLRTWSVPTKLIATSDIASQALNRPVTLKDIKGTELWDAIDKMGNYEGVEINGKMYMNPLWELKSYSVGE